MKIYNYFKIVFVKEVFPGFSLEIFEGVVAFSGVVQLGSISNVTQSAT